MRTKDSGYLFLGDDNLMLDFPYDAAQVAGINKINCAKWDKVGKVWKVPLASIDDVRAFAQSYNFVIDNQVLRFDTPKTKSSRRVQISHEGKYLYLEVPYDRVKVHAIKQISF